jgi:hypothetical protein
MAFIVIVLTLWCSANTRPAPIAVQARACAVRCPCAFGRTGIENFVMQGRAGGGGGWESGVGVGWGGARAGVGEGLQRVQI